MPRRHRHANAPAHGRPGGREGLPRRWSAASAPGHGGRGRRGDRIPGVRRGVLPHWRRRPHRRRQHGDLRGAAMTEYPHVHVEGAAEQRGRQYGEQARERVQRSVSAYRDVFAALAGWDWDTVRAEAARFEAPIAAFGPQYLAEMRGIADGAATDFGDV